MSQTDFQWNFPSNNHGEKTGISEAGIETFKGDLFASLAREICQNSMDARLDQDSAVHIEFQVSKVKTNQILGMETLKGAIDKCATFWANEHDKKAIDFFNRGKNVINQEEIAVLRISDFNTKGVTGAEELQNSPWQNLVKSAGVSNKSGDSGGSFGIGKSAPYAVSHLRTIFYSTYDSDGIRAYQGVAKLATFQDDDGETTQGKGYLGEKTNNTPVLGRNFPFGTYQRKATGTDIFVIGFHEQSGWADEILKAVIEGYMISISQGDLTVSVSDVLLNKDTLGDYLEKYKEKLSLTYQYFEVLNSEKSPWMSFDVDGLQSIRLKIGAQSGYSRRILMARSNGMKIFDQSRISTTFEFAGICILQNEVNSYFRSMENPQHTKWEADRFSDDPKERKEAEKRRKALINMIKEQVKQLGAAEIADEMDAIGAGEFIPALTDSELPEKNKKENINDEVKGFTTLESMDYKQNVKGSQKILEHQQAETADLEHGEESLEGWDGEEGDFQGNGEGKSTGIPNPNSPNSSGGQLAEVDETGNPKIASFVPLKVRLFLKNADLQLYSLSFTPQLSASNASISIFIVGEQGRSQAILKNALDSELNNLLIERNEISIGSLKGNEKTNCYFSLKTKGQYSMEVEVNGYKA